MIENLISYYQYMSKIHPIAAITISILFLSACSTAPASTDLQTNLFTMDNYLLNPTQISQLMQDSTKAADLKIIDVRTPEEFATSCLKGAKVIDIRSDDFDKKLPGWTKTPNIWSIAAPVTAARTP